MLAASRAREEIRRATIASWLVTPHPDGLKAVRAAIGRESDLEYRGEENGQLIVVSESVFGAGLDDVAQRLTSIPGVVALALVAAFDEDEETA